MAEALERSFCWRSREEWRDAGGRVHALQGLLRLDPNSDGPLSHKSATVHASYEAEQYILHLGRAAEPVCWTLAGFASRYLSRTEGRPIYVIEQRCVGAGAAACDSPRAHVKTGAACSLRTCPSSRQRSSIHPLYARQRRSDARRAGSAGCSPRTAGIAKARAA